MPIVLTLGAVTATSQSFQMAGWGASGTIQLQISPRPDFQFCVAPIYPGIPRATPYIANGLNQEATYYARARTALADGTVEPWSNVVGFRTPLAAPRNLVPPAILIDPAIIMRPEPILSWTATNEQAGYPAKNVSRDAPVAWRSVAAGGTHILDLEHAGAPVDTFAFLNSNMPEASTLIIRAADTAAGLPAGAIQSNAAFRATANMPGRDGYHGLVRLAAPVNFKFFRFQFTATGGAGMMPGNMLHMEHVLIGLNRKSKNHALEKTETPLHLGSKERTRTGTPDKVEGLKMRRVEFDLAWLTETQSETLYHEIGAWLDEPVFVVPNSKAGAYLHDRMLYGDLKTIRTSQPSSLHYTRTLGVESLI